MAELVLAALYLPVSHFGISSTRLRTWLVTRVGERPYLGLYSLNTLVAFTWLITAYRHAPLHQLWISPASVRLAALPIVLLAFLLGGVGLTTPNPTVVGAEALFDRRDIVKGILRVTRNPFLWGVSLWALAHIAATGDLAGVLLFGSIGALGLVGSRLLDAKKARTHGTRWQEFAAQTSSLPFLAIVRGRQRLVLGEIALWRIVLALGLFILVLLVHRWAFGVSPLQGG
jgi:uncharacterized membrane protein